MANPEEYTFSFSAEVASGANSSRGVEDALIIGGTHEVGVGVVGEGGVDVFGADICCMPERTGKQQVSS